MTLDLTDFELSDMTRCGATLRQAGANANCMEDVAQGIVSDLYEQLLDSSGRRCCVLVRLFTTLDYSELSEDLQGFGRELMPDHRIGAGTKCLTLMATTGDQPAWNSRRTSAGHQTIPLPGAQVVVKAPMISQLILQLGLDVNAVVQPAPALLLQLDKQTYNVFHVVDARNSPYIPAQQEFVIPYSVRSVLGFGGMFPTGNMFAVLMFTRVEVPRTTAEMFRTAALTAKIALLPFSKGPIFSAR